MMAQVRTIREMKRLCREDGRVACNTAGEDEVCVTMKEIIISGWGRQFGFRLTGVTYRDVYGTSEEPIRLRLLKRLKNARH